MSHSDESNDTDRTFESNQAADGSRTIDSGQSSLPSAPASRIGQRADFADFELRELIGRGGMGMVYRAYDRQMRREVAIKLLLDQYAPDSAVGRRFIEEARITGRLQHPGIPAVYQMGMTEEGRPYLAMKLIHGQTLAELLKQPEPLDVLSIFVAISEAVGYAHANGVIHRDLKPSNIMVGPFGEVQVMDWGLAKEMQPTSNRPAEPRGRSEVFAAESLTDEEWDQDAGKTQYGSMLGTPAFMAPEQAAGQLDRFGPATDVFGLGGILCVILTGKPPYDEHDLESVRAMALQGNTQSAMERLAQCSGDPQLVELCRRCLAFEPGDRPANGEAVAASLRRIRRLADERVRRAENDRLAAEVAAREQTKRRRLVQRSAGVIVAVLLFGLIVSLWQTHRAVVAEAAANDNATRAEVNAQLARSHAQAAEANEKAALRERDAKDRALQAETRALLAAQTTRQQAIAALRSLTDDVVQDLLARSPSLSESNKAFLRRVIEHYEDLAAVIGDDRECRAIRAEGLSRIAHLRHWLGERDEAEKAFLAALKGYTSLVHDFPDSILYQMQLAKTYGNYGNMLGVLKRYAETEAAYRQAHDIQAQLVAKHPNNLEVIRYFAGAKTNLGLHLANTDRLKEAEASYREAESIFERLIEENPLRVDLVSEWSSCLNDFGLVLIRQGRSDEAIAALQRAADNLRAIISRGGGSLDIQQSLAKTYNNFGGQLRLRGQTTEAVAAMEKAIAILRPLVAEYGTQTDVRHELAQSCINLSNALQDLGRLLDADALLGEAATLLTTLAEKHPERLDYRQTLGICHHNIGFLCYRQRRVPEAMSAFEKAARVREQLVRDSPRKADYRRELASTLSVLGTLLSDGRQWASAEKALQSAVEISRQLNQDFPQVPEFQNELGANLVNLSASENARGRSAEAKKLLIESLPYFEAALKAQPGHVTFRRYYRNALRNLTQTHARLNEADDAIKTAYKIRDLGWAPALHAYDAAGVLSLCVGTAAALNPPGSPEARELSQRYGDEAMKLLGEALEKGFADLQKLKNDSEFRFLHGREDFQKLIQMRP